MTLMKWHTLLEEYSTRKRGSEFLILVLPSSMFCDFREITFPSKDIRHMHVKNLLIQKIKNLPIYPYNGNVIKYRSYFVNKIKGA